MLPILTEGWAVAYFQILVTLLLFAFGIPALLFQIILPENTRGFVHKYLIRISVPIFLFAILITVSLVVLIWIIHPANSPNSSATSVSPFKHWFVAITVTIILSVTIFIWWRILSKMLKERLLLYLEKKAEKVFKKTKVLPEILLNDLGVLGQRSEAGLGKELVLISIQKLAKKVQSSDSYTGCELETLLREISQIIVNKEKPGDENNSRLALTILIEIKKSINKKEKEFCQDDLLVHDAMKKVALKALDFDDLFLFQLIAEAFEESSDLLFEIGAASLAVSRYQESVATLSKLESACFKQIGSNSGKTISYFVGLAAHFWENNTNSRRRARSFLSENKLLFQPSLNRQVDDAIEFFYRNLDYDTGEKLIRMRQDSDFLEI